MSQIQDGMITYEEFALPEKREKIIAFVREYGMGVACESDTHKPSFLMVNVEPMKALREEFVSNDPLRLGWAVITRFMELYGMDKTHRLLHLRDNAFDALKLLDLTSSEASNSINESFNHMKDLLSQMSDFNNV